MDCGNSHLEACYPVKGVNPACFVPKTLLIAYLQSDLTKQQNGFKITLKTLEDDLLSRLSSASGNFLGDTALVENLETTKQTAAEIEEKVK